MAVLGDGGGTGYPAAIDTRQTYVNGPAPITDSNARMDAEVLNDVLAATVAIQTELGIAPSEAYATLVARLNAYLPTAAGAGQLVMPVGAVGAPGLAVEGALTTGIYRPAAAEIAVTLAGTQRLLLQAATITFTSSQTVTGHVWALKHAGTGGADFLRVEIDGNGDPFLRGGVGHYFYVRSEQILRLGALGADRLEIEAGGMWPTAPVADNAFQLGFENTNRISSIWLGTNLNVDADAAFGQLAGNNTGQMRLGAAQDVGIGRSAAGQAQLWTADNARTNTVLDSFVIAAVTTGTPAAGIGTGLLFRAESADESPADMGSLAFGLNDVGAATEDSFAKIFLRTAGGAVTSEAFRVEYTSSGVAQLGFFGTVAARQDYTVTNPITDRSLEVTTPTLAETAAVLGTLIQDLINHGILI